MPASPFPVVGIPSAGPCISGIKRMGIKRKQQKTGLVSEMTSVLRHGLKRYLSGPVFFLVDLPVSLLSLLTGEGV